MNLVGVLRVWGKGWNLEEHNALEDLQEGAYHIDLVVRLVEGQMDSTMAEQRVVRSHI